MFRRLRSPKDTPPPEERSAPRNLLGEERDAALRATFAWSEGDDAFLSVSDQGPGIAPADHHRIFERFESATRARLSGGLGLGLFIVRQIVGLHLGEVRVESEPGKGTTFTVRLPRHASDDSPQSRM
ncbi:MAG: sensor histidine kinase [Deltaproteobacteria bacterium]|nr:sensor histidine kinase [Deltaproteobacteria bacterium]